MRAAPGALARAVPLLRCPVCGDALAEVESGVRCARGHVFDRARQGYLTLFGPAGRRFSGDTAEQVASRERVFASGAFDPVRETVVDDVAEHAAVDSDRGPVVLEAGAGTGVYLAAALDRLSSRGAHAAPLGLGTELSLPAARRLARVHPQVAALVADTWERLPLADGCVDAVMVVFAPRNAAEFARVLRPGGVLVVAVPGPGHLEPLRSELGMLEPAAGKDERLASDLEPHLVPVGTRELDVVVPVPAEVALDLALMGPSGVHLDRGTASVTGGRRVRLHVRVHTFRRRAPRGQSSSVA